MAYEFKAEDSKVIKSVGQKALVIAVLMSYGGLLKVILALIESRTDVFLLLLKSIQGVMQIFAGWVFFRPSDNLRKIHDTEGEDIEELMVGIEEMSIGFFIAFFLVFLSLVMDAGLYFWGVY